MFLNAPRPRRSADVRRILIVDDDQQAADTLAAIVRMALDCQVETAYNGAEALDMASDLHPDTIVMDIRMPQVDGLEAGDIFQKLFERDPPRLIAVTGLADLQTREKAQACGFHELLPKPIDVDELLQLLMQTPGETTADSAA